MTDDLRRSLQRCSLDGVVFPVTTTDQQGGRAVTEHEQWGRDGAELVDGGRKAYRGKLTAAFVNGLSGWPDLYPATFTAVVTRLEGLGDMRMAHPLLGTFTVQVPEWVPRVASGVRNGAFLDLSWTEQRASSVGVVAVDRPSTDVVDDLDASAAAADAAVADVVTVLRATPGAKVPTGILTTLARGAATVRLAVGRALAPIGEVQGAISGLRRQLDDALRLVSLAPLTSTIRMVVHAGRAAVFRCKGTLARLEEQVSNPLGLGRRVTAPREMTVGEFAAWVYRDTTKARLLRTVNGLASDTIRAGTTLVVP